MGNPDTIAEALRLLAQLLAEGQPLRVRIERGGDVAELTVAPAGASSSSMVEPLTLPSKGVKLFSPIEESVLRAATPNWQTAAELAEKTQQQPGHWFYAILGNLADRGYLDSGRNGYRKLADAAPPVPEPAQACPTLEQLSGRAPGKLFSTIEVSILAAATDDWQTAAQLAEKTGQTASSWFRAILSNLVEREWLRGGRNGYRLAQKESQS